MTDLLKSGAAWLEAQRAAKLATSVTYRRGGIGSGFAVAGTIGRTEADQVIDATSITSAGIRDWIMSYTAFEVSSTFVPPAIGDTIEEADGALWKVVEIGGEPCWRYSSPHKNSIRIHVVKIGE